MWPEPHLPSLLSPRAQLKESKCLELVPFQVQMLSCGPPLCIHLAWGFLRPSQADFTTEHPSAGPHLQPRAMPVCLSCIGPSRPGPIIGVPEPLQGSQSSNYSQGRVQSFSLLNSFFVSTPPPQPHTLSSRFRVRGGKYLHACIPSLKYFRRWCTLIGLLKKYLSFQIASGNATIKTF